MNQINELVLPSAFNISVEALDAALVRGGNTDNAIVSVERVVVSISKNGSPVFQVDFSYQDEEHVECGRCWLRVGDDDQLLGDF